MVARPTSPPDSRSSLPELSMAQELLRLVDQELASTNIKLSFQPLLEAFYEEETAKERQRRVFWGGIVACASYNLFFFADPAVVPDLISFMVWLRLAFVVPASMLFLWLMRQKIRPVVRETALSVGTLVVATALILPLVLSQHDNVRFCHATILLAPIFGNLMARQSFSYAAVTSALILIGYGAALPFCKYLTLEVSGYLVSVLLSAILFTLYGNYIMDRESRRSYLYGLRERMRRAGLLEHNAALTELASLDPLTGLANRREFEWRLDALLMEGTPVTLIVIDVDHFKAFNDTYGHPAGDDCLRRVAESVKKSTREHGDLAARVGGEEFALLLPGLGQAQAQAAAERVCRGVEALQIPHHSSATARVVTISVGVATSSPGDSKADLVSAADEFLYRAKAAGRNRVCPVNELVQRAHG